jgi:hypothetical protein
MGVNATQLAYRALRDIGCIGPGQTTSADILADILAALNEHIDLDLLNPLMVYAFRPDIYNLQASLQTYLIGPGQAPPNFNAARPTEIHKANIVLNDVTPFVRLPLSVINVDDFASIRVRAIPSAIPLDLYYVKDFDNTSGFGTLQLWPGPLKNYQLELFTWQQLQAFPDLTTALNFPPGYVKYLRKTLAVEIAPMMELNNKLANLAKPRPSLLQLVMKQAQDAKEDIESYNAQDPKLSCDEAFRGGNSGGAFNYMVGSVVTRG